MIDDRMIRDWRENYALNTGTPAEAARWWWIHNDGHAPVGAVEALGLCINEIARLRAWQRAAIDMLRTSYGPACAEHDPECLTCQAHDLIGGAQS